jgi:transposase
VTGTMTWAAMDVHARSTYAASLDVMSGEVARQRFDTGAVEPVVAWLSGLPGPVRACYEAGPTGFGLYRAAVAAGIGCQVIAPSKTPRPSGDRNKSDRRDTDLLLRQLMAGALTAVAVPSATFEAARDLARAREQVRVDLMRCRHRLSKLLLRHGRVWDRTAWTKTHRQWLSAQAFEQVNTELAFIDNLAACEGLSSRRQALDERLSWVALDPEFWPIVRRLRAFRGLDTLSALIIVLEVADFTRFPRAVQLGSWLGLVPSREQSGESDRHGSITKTGSKYARRILVEAAWHYARPPRIGRTLYERQAQAVVGARGAGRAGGHDQPVWRGDGPHAGYGRAVRATTDLRANEAGARPEAGCRGSSGAPPEIDPSISARIREGARSWQHAPTDRRAAEQRSDPYRAWRTMARFYASASARPPTMNSIEETSG